MEKTFVMMPMGRRRFLRGMLAGTVLLAGNFPGIASTISAMSSRPAREDFKLAPLPYPDDALSPYISARTLEFHHRRHHRAYIDKTNQLVQGTEYAKMPLEEIIKKTAGNSEGHAIFNNAAQAWNHDFYWKSMKPGGGGAPPENLARRIEAGFGSFENFKKAFAEAAATQFGSGWAWLVADKGSLKVVKTGNADTPLAHGRIPLVAIDVWEHAYYLDYQNRRGDYIAAFLEHLLNWDFAQKNFERI